MTITAALPHPEEDPFTGVRALNHSRSAGFTLRVTTDGRLIATPTERLTDEWRAFLREHKPALIALLMDAQTLYEALQAAEDAGLAWRAGTPPDWTDAHLLAAGEVLYSDGRMVNRLGRRYASEHAL